MVVGFKFWMNFIHIIHGFNKYEQACYFQAHCLFDVLCCLWIPVILVFYGSNPSLLKTSTEFSSGVSSIVMMPFRLHCTLFHYFSFILFFSLIIDSNEWGMEGMGTYCRLTWRWQSKSKDFYGGFLRYCIFRSESGKQKCHLFSFIRIRVLLWKEVGASHDPA